MIDFVPFILTIIFTSAIFGYITWIYGYTKGWHDCEKFAADAMLEIAKELRNNE